MVKNQSKTAKLSSQSSSFRSLITVLAPCLMGISPSPALELPVVERVLFFCWVYFQSPLAVMFT